MKLTSDPRVMAASYGRENFRLLVQYEGDPGWHITGPPYPTMAVALGHVRETARAHYGGSQAMETDRFRREAVPGVTVLLDESLHLMIEVNGERRTMTNGDLITLRH